MTTSVLGAISFDDTPDVNGIPILTTSTGLSLGSITGTAGILTVTGTSNLVLDLADNPIIPGTAGMILPKGTSGQRPGSPVAGVTRFNTTIGNTETFDGTSWIPFGQILQTVTGSIPANTGTTQVPWDNTTPTSSEGYQVWTVSFTPLSATSKISISQTFCVSSSVSARVATTSFFNGSTNIGAVGTYCQTNSIPYSCALTVVHSPGSTSAITFSCRIGLNSNGNCLINQTSVGNLGGAAASSYIITEIAS